MIQLFNVSKKYGAFRDALLDVSFQIASGEFVFLTGPSGAGKSTLLRLLFLEEPPTAGQIIVNGRNIGVLPPSQIPYLRRTMGVVFVSRIASTVRASTSEHDSARMPPEIAWIWES